MSAPIIKPQTIDAFEAGFKSELFDRMLRLNVAAFHYKIKDYQVRTSLPGGFGTALLLNAGRVKSEGVEAEFVIAPTRELRINGNATYLKSRFTSFPNNSVFVPRTVDNVATPCIRGTGAPTGGNTSCVVSSTGNRTPLSPTLAFSLGFTYTMDVGSEGQLIANGLWSHTSTVYFEADERLNQPTVNVFNAAFEYRPSPNWGVELFVNNLTDKRYYITSGAASTGDHSELAPPRTYGVNVKFDF